MISGFGLALPRLSQVGVKLGSRGRVHVSVRSCPLLIFVLLAGCNESPIVAESSLATTTVLLTTRSVMQTEAESASEALSEEWDPAAYQDPKPSDDDPFGSCSSCGCWSP